MTDWELLVDVIEPSLESSEFFLRKAWAESEAVLAWVEEIKGRLCVLSKREGLRHLLARGVVASAPCS